MNFSSVLFDGSLDQAETWLTQFIFVLNRRGELVEAKIEDQAFPATALVWRERLSLEPLPETMGMRRFKITITTQVDNELHANDLGHILLTPLPKSTRLEMATLESHSMREGLEHFWKKVRQHMRADVVLIEPSQEPKHNEEKLDRLLPRDANGFRPRPDTLEQKLLVLAIYDSQPAGQKERWLRAQFGGTRQDPTLPPSSVRSWRRRLIGAR